MQRRGITDSQILDAYHENGGNKAAAARQLKMDPRGYRRRIGVLAPKIPVAADGYAVSRTSTLTDAEGNVVLEWTRRDLERDRELESLQAFAEGLKEQIKPVKPLKAPKRSDIDLLTQYTITDYHLGMYAWDEESGANWDLKIAEELILSWMAMAISLSPRSQVGLLAQMGDWGHWDGLEAVTPQHGHVLDADTRFQKLVRYSIRVARQVITMMLKHHQEVRIIWAEGNHDIASSAWMRELLAELYRDEPRVTVDTSPDVYYCIEWGDTSIFIHHGHKRSLAKVDEAFAGKFREVFGRTKYSYGHVGHRHNQQVRESNLMTIEQHPTLAAADAYSSGLGFTSQRNAKVITYHRQFGKCAEFTISPEMVR